MLTEVDWGSPRADSIQIAAESNAACKSLASFKSPSQEHPTTETRRDSAIRRQRVPQLGLRRRLYPGVQQRPANIAEPLVTRSRGTHQTSAAVRWAECQVREDEE